MIALPNQPEEMRWVDRASRQIALGKTSGEILDLLIQALESQPIPWVLLKVDKGILSVLSRSSMFSTPERFEFEELPLSSIQDGLFNITPVFLSETAGEDIDREPLQKLTRLIPNAQVVLFPIFAGESLAASILVGTDPEENIDLSRLQPYLCLAELVSETLERVLTIEELEKQVAVLQMLETVNKSISAETELSLLYPLIHKQILAAAGEVDCLIALFDPETGLIEIPYAYEQGNQVNLPPLTLGRGLTSILIRTRQPLLLTGEKDNEAESLGAQVIGLPAKSWLGVPLLVSGESTGAIILQDPVNSGRFHEEDIQWLTLLAAQVASAVRNARLLEITRKQAERERVIAEITAKVWASTSVENILSTTLLELGRTLRISDGLVQMGWIEEGEL